MTDKNKSRDEEYQFPDDEFIDDIHAELADSSAETAEQEQPQLIVEEEPAQPSGIAAVWATHRRIIIVVGVVTIVALTFAAMRAFKKPQEVAQPVQAPPVAAAPAIQPALDPQVVGQLASLKQDSVNNGAAVRQLQSQVQQLTNTLNQTRAAQQQLNQSLMVLVTQVQQLAAEMKVLARPKPAQVEKPAPKVNPVPVITFQLRAVVPGRAWVVGSDGQSHSVTVGDHVPQYGTVQSIDADAGVVVTTSGKTIKF